MSDEPMSREQMIAHQQIVLSSLRETGRCTRCESCAKTASLVAENDAATVLAALRQPPAPEPPAIVALAWEDGWRQRHALHNAALGIRILEKPRRLDAFLTSNGLPAMPKRTGPIDGRALMDAAFDDAQPDTRGDPR